MINLALTTDPHLLSALSPCLRGVAEKREKGSKTTYLKCKRSKIDGIDVNIGIGRMYIFIADQTILFLPKI